MKLLQILIINLLALHGYNQIQSNTQFNCLKTPYNDTTFVNITDYSNDFILDLKYATTDNFLHTKVYDCATCFLRYKTIKKLIAISKLLKKKNIKIKLFDCYRPLDIQKKMWALVSDPNYVANPAKGSIHNRGCAVDITLVDKNGIDFDMGTSFDFFGIEAGHAYQNLPKKVLSNRLYLKSIMIENGFKSFDSEWWHYNLNDGSAEKIANFKWPCN